VRSEGDPGLPFDPITGHRRPGEVSQSGSGPGPGGGPHSGDPVLFPRWKDHCDGHRATGTSWRRLPPVRQRGQLVGAPFREEDLRQRVAGPIIAKAASDAEGHPLGGRPGHGRMDDPEMTRPATCSPRRGLDDPEERGLPTSGPTRTWSRPRPGMPVGPVAAGRRDGHSSPAFLPAVAGRGAEDELPERIRRPPEARSRRPARCGTPRRPRVERCRALPWSAAES
jgi:hypothetical protein